MIYDSHYDSEDKENAIKILSDLVEDNKRLKEKLLHAHTFLMALLLNSENGEIKFTDSVLRHVEDIEQLVRNVGLEINLDTMSSGSTDGVVNGNKLWAWRQPTISNRFQLSKEELLTKFEQVRYKDEEEK